MSRKNLLRRVARLAHDFAAIINIATRPPRRKVPSNQAGAPVEQAIIQVLAKQEPLTGKRIAAKTGYAYERYLRATLASMVKRGVLSRSSDGYARVPCP